MPATQLRQPDYTKFVFPDPANFGQVFGVTGDPIVITIPFGPQQPPPTFTITQGVLQGAAALPEATVSFFRAAQGLDSTYGVTQVRRLLYHDMMIVMQETNRLAPAATNPHHVPSTITTEIIELSQRNSATALGVRV